MICSIDVGPILLRLSKQSSGGYMSENSNELISIVIPVYCEEEVLPLLRNRLAPVLDQMEQACEVLLVNDGSRDNSLSLMREIAIEDPRFRIINLSRNYGHQIAVTAGINESRGDAVITMDADLQDPPEVSLELISKWQEGFDVVLARRLKRDGETLFKRVTARLFYRLVNMLSASDMPVDVGDFRLIDRRVVDALNRMPEQDRYLRGMIGWVGFQTAYVTFRRPERVAGSTKYPLRSMIKLALNGIIGFSDIPLRIALWLGLFVSAGALSFGLWILISWSFADQVVQGWTSTMVVLAFLGGIQLLMIGIAGLYVGRIYNEVKKRPLYFLDPPKENADNSRPQTHQPTNSASGGADAGGADAAQTSQASVSPSSETR